MTDYTARGVKVDSTLTDDHAGIPLYDHLHGTEIFQTPSSISTKPITLTMSYYIATPLCHEKSCILMRINHTRKEVYFRKYNPKTLKSTELKHSASHHTFRDGMYVHPPLPLSTQNCPPLVPKRLPITSSTMMARTTPIPILSIKYIPRSV